MNQGTTEDNFLRWPSMGAILRLNRQPEGSSMNPMRITIAILMVLLIRLAFPQEAAESESFTAIKQSAEQGDARAQLMIGSAYRTGAGVPKDFVLAHMWFNLAASQLTGDGRQMSVEYRDKIEKRITRE